MTDMYVKVSDLAEYCDTNSAYLQGKGQSVAQAALRWVKEYAIENAADVQPDFKVNDAAEQAFRQGYTAGFNEGMKHTCEVKADNERLKRENALLRGQLEVRSRVDDMDGEFEWMIKNAVKTATMVKFGQSVKGLASLAVWYVG